MLTGITVALEVGLLRFAETRVPERATCGARTARTECNGVLGALALAATGALETPLVSRVAAIAERRGWGLLPRLQCPPAMRALLSVVLLDYGIYVWHVALHRVPLLWRLHVVHHADRDCDTSTALRIHIADIVLSVVIRVAQVVTLGVTPRDFALWQRLFGASVLFHHANVTLPPELERILGMLIMTPRRHAIHHRSDRRAQHGNWSSGLIVWDWLHGTLREDDAAGEMGLPAYRAAADVTLAKMIALPVSEQPDPWRRR